LEENCYTKYPHKRPNYCNSNNLGARGGQNGTSRGAARGRSAHVGQAVVNSGHFENEFDNDNFNCTNDDAFGMNKNHQQYKKTCYSNSDENRAFLSVTNSETRKPPPVFRPKDAGKFLLRNLY
jgi:hypothetical protein